MSSTIASFDLPERPNQEDCEALLEFIDDTFPDLDITINAQASKRVGALMAQVLVSGANYANELHRSFTISEPSQEFSESLGLLGIADDFFKTESAA